MNKLDKQFAEIMKDIRIESPSEDFRLKLMSRILAEAAVKPRQLLQDYQPVISKRAWIIMISTFVILIIYVLASGSNTSPAADSGFLGTISGKLQSINTSGIRSVWEKGMGVFSTIPPVAYLIVMSSLALWTLDLFLTKFRHENK